MKFVSSNNMVRMHPPGTERNENDPLFRYSILAQSFIRRVNLHVCPSRRKHMGQLPPLPHEWFLPQEKRKPAAQCSGLF